MKFYLLDTNHLSAAINDDPGIRRRLPDVVLAAIAGLTEVGCVRTRRLIAKSVA